MFFRFLARAEWHVLERLVGDYVLKSAEPDRRKGRALALVAGVWAQKEPWDAWQGEALEVGFSLLGKIDRLVDSPEDLPRLQDFLKALRRRVSDLDQPTIDQIAARIELAEALLLAPVPIHWLKEAQGVLMARPNEKDLRAASELEQLALYLDVADRDGAPTLISFIRKALGAARVGREGGDKVKGAALKLVEFAKPRLPSHAWDALADERPRGGAATAGTLAVVFLTGGGERNAEPWQVPCQVQIRWRSSESDRFEVPGLEVGSVEGRVGETFSLDVGDLSDESLAKVREWLAIRLEQALVWIKQTAPGTLLRTKIEFFLPLQLIHEPVHAWEVGEDPDGRLPISQNFHVVVRTIDRCRSALRLSLVQERIETRAFRLGWCPLPMSANPSPELNASLINDPCIAYQHELHAETDDEALRKALKGGTPYLLWLAGLCTDPRACAKSRYQSPFEPASADELLHAVKRERDRLGDEARRLTLIFESAGPVPAFDAVSPYDLSHR